MGKGTDKDTPTPLIIYLEQSWVRACKGEPTLLALVNRGGGSSLGLVRAWAETRQGESPRMLCLDAAHGGNLPHFPFLDTLRTIDGSLDGLNPWARHEIALQVCLGRAPEGSLETVEDLILEELPMEKRRLRHTIAAMLTKATKAAPLVVHCSHAEFISDETIEMLQSKDFPGTARIFILLEYGSHPRSPLQEQFLGELHSRGMKSSFQSEGHPVPMDMDVKAPRPGLVDLHIQLLDFSRALALADTSRDDWRSSVWKARCHEAREEYEEALLSLQHALVHLGEEEGRDRCVVLRLLARQFRYLPDPETAASLAAKASALAECLDDAREHARCLFLQHMISSVRPMDLAELGTIEQRLEEILARIGWQNHLAAVLGQSASTMRHYRLHGSAAAMERCLRALRIARALGNTRRQASAHHAISLIRQADQDVEGALKCFAASRRAYSKAVFPQELARSWNGQGFLYFTTGRYREALRSHREALRLLRLTRHFEESLMTAINVGRVQLFAGHPAEAASLLESADSILETLHIGDLPFLDRETLGSLLGLAALRNGNLASALEHERRMVAESARRGLNPQGPLFRSWFQALLAEHLDDGVEADRRWADCWEAFEGKSWDLRYVEPAVAVDHAAWLDKRHRPEEARALRMKALAECTEGRVHPWEYQCLLAGIQSSPAPLPPALPDFPLDAPRLLESIQHDIRIRAWRRTARLSAFLLAWQEGVQLETTTGGLVRRCESLIHQHFLVDSLVVAIPEAMPEDLKARFGMEVVHAEGQTLSGTGFQSASWIPSRVLPESMPWFFAASGKGNLRFNLEDHRTLVMAARFLESTVLERHQAREVQLLNEKLLMAQADLIQSEKLALQGSLVAGISHEINTPIGVSVTGLSHLGTQTARIRALWEQKSLKESQFADFLDLCGNTSDLVLRNLERASVLIQNFKQVASDQISEERRQFALREYLEEVLVTLGPRLKQSSVKVVVEGPADLYMDSYPGALAQVVTNLVLNALVHAFPPGMSGQVVLAMTDMGNGKVELSCSDNGTGIAPEHRDRIFNAFYTTRRHLGGTGLGLHIVANLSNRPLGGRIRFETEVGAGTRFLLELPLVAPPDGGSQRWRPDQS